MARGTTAHLTSLETRSATLFLAAGILFVGYATFNGVHAATGVAYESVENVFGPAGFAIGFLGLLGLYPTVSDHSPTVARAGALCAVSGIVAFTVFVVVNLGEIVGLLSPHPPEWAVVFLAMAAIGMLPGYFSFAVAVLRSRGQSRLLGLLLLTPLAIFGTMLATSRLGYFPQWLAFAISAGQAGAHLTIGYTLWRERPRPGRELSADDVVVS